MYHHFLVCLYPLSHQDLQDNQQIQVDLAFLFPQVAQEHQLHPLGLRCLLLLVDLLRQFSRLGREYHELLFLPGHPLPLRFLVLPFDPAHLEYLFPLDHL